MTAMQHDQSPPEAPDGEPVSIDRFRQAPDDPGGGAVPIGTPPSSEEADPKPPVPTDQRATVPALPQAPTPPPAAAQAPVLASGGTLPQPSPGQPVAPVPPPAPPVLPAVPARAIAPPAAPAIVSPPPGSVRPARQASAPAPQPMQQVTSSTAPSRRGPSPFGVALVVGALVMVGGVAFAAGRVSVDETGGGSLTAAVGAGGAGQALGDGQARVGPLAAAAAAGTSVAGDAQGSADRRDEAGIRPRAQGTDGFGAGITVDGFGGAVDGFGGNTIAPPRLGIEGVADTIGGEQAASDGAIAQADGTGQADGQRPRGPGARGGRGGFGAGGISGRVVGIGDVGITLGTEDGAEVRFFVDETTSFLSEIPADPAGLAAGDLVRIAFPLPTVVDGEPVAAEGADIAAAVTVLPPGTELTGGFGSGGPAADGFGGGRQRAAGEDGFGGQQGQGGQGGRAGFGRGIVQGSLIEIDEATLTVLTPTEETVSIAYAETTTWALQSPADPGQMEVGDPVRIGIARGGFARGGRLGFARRSASGSDDHASWSRQPADRDARGGAPGRHRTTGGSAGPPG